MGFVYAGLVDVNKGALQVFFFLICSASRMPPDGGAMKLVLYMYRCVNASPCFFLFFLSDALQTLTSLSCPLTYRLVM